MPTRAEESERPARRQKEIKKKMTDGARQRSSTAGSSKDAAEGKQSGGAVALKKEIGLVSACGIIVGKCSKSRVHPRFGAQKKKKSSAAICYTCVRVTLRSASGSDSTRV